MKTQWRKIIHEKKKNVPRRHHYFLTYCLSVSAGLHFCPCSLPSSRFNNMSQERWFHLLFFGGWGFGKSYKHSPLSSLPDESQHDINIAKYCWVIRKSFRLFPSGVETENCFACLLWHSFFCIRCPTVRHKPCIFPDTLAMGTVITLKWLLTGNEALKSTFLRWELSSTVWLLMLYQELHSYCWWLLAQ